MSEFRLPPLESILIHCQAVEPNAWFPSRDVDLATVEPRQLNACLSILRKAGYLELCEWRDEAGQGFRITPFGRELLSNPEQRRLLRQGMVRSGVEQKPLLTDPHLIERAQTVRQAWDSTSQPFVTMALLLINVVWFGYGVVIGLRDGAPLDSFGLGTTAHVFEATGGLFGADILERHQWWRLLSCCFVHIGFLHLAVNMYSLYVVGPSLERLWGGWRFLMLYLVAGVCGSSTMMIVNPQSGGAGASGALWGIMGSLGTWLVLNRSVLTDSFVRTCRRQLVYTLLLNLAITFGIPQISKGAHLGGCAAGMLAAWPLDALRFSKKHLWFPALCFLAIPATFLGALAMVVAQNQRAELLQQQQALDPLHGEIAARMDHAARQIMVFIENEALPLLTMDPPHRRATAVKNIGTRLGFLLDQLDKDSGSLEELSGVESAPAQLERQRLLAANRGLRQMLERFREKLDRKEIWTDEDDEFISTSMNALTRTRR